MMKKTKILLGLLLLLYGFSTRAQPLFSITTSPVDSMTLGQADPFTYIEPTSFLVNESTTPLILYWQLITDTTFYPNDWTFFSIADNFLVRAPASGVFQHAVQHTAPIAPGDSSVMKLLVNVPVTSPNGGGGLFKIKVFDTLQTQVDTMVYRICKGVGCIFPAYGPGGPSSIRDLSAGNALFSVYPNPVTDKAYIKMKETLVRPSELTLYLYDYTGRLAGQQVLKSVQEQVQLAQYKPGLYFIRLYEKGKYLGGQKIIRH
jgi:hypothetical protein